LVNVITPSLIRATVAGFSAMFASSEHYPTGREWIARTSSGDHRSARPRRRWHGGPRFASSQSYIPKHLAEMILTSQCARARRFAPQ
jgi:hypothetical protein